MSTTKAPKPELPVLPFESADEFENWLRNNFTLKSGIWMHIYKKHTGIRSISYDEALEVALCYGWIDGQLKSLGTESYIQKFTPRRRKSIWSKRNIEKTERLIAEGRMKEPGLREIEAAKADGRFEKAYDSPTNMVIPDDFLHEVTKNEKAFEFLKTLNKTNLYAIGWRLQTATNATTRAKRIAEIIAKLEKEERLR